MQLLDERSLTYLEKGCAILGGGGGGDTSLAVAPIRIALRAAKSVDLVRLSELPDDSVVMPVAFVGSAAIGAERLWNGDEGFRLRAAIEERVGARVAAVMSGEIGGMNGLAPMYWAARLGLPLADVDGIGRAFPMVHQTKMHILGVPASPCVLTDEHSNTLTIEAATNEQLAELVGHAAMSLGGSCIASLYAMSVDVARRTTVHGSVTRAIRIGRILSRERNDDPIASLCQELSGVELVAGKVTDVERQTGTRFVQGSMLIAPDARAKGRLLRIEFQNENLAALEEGRVVASVPDIIAVLDAYSGEPIQIERVRYGQRVRVIAFPADPIWRSARGLEIAGPSAFGYDFAFVPFEESVITAS